MKIKVWKFEKKPCKKCIKLRLNKNKQIEYTNKLMKETLLENAQRQGKSATVWLGQEEWTQLSEIYDMEIGY